MNRAVGLVLLVVAVILIAAAGGTDITKDSFETIRQTWSLEGEDLVTRAGFMILGIVLGWFGFALLFGPKS